MSIFSGKDGVSRQEPCERSRRARKYACYYELYALRGRYLTLRERARCTHHQCARYKYVREDEIHRDARDEHYCLQISWSRGECASVGDDRGSLTSIDRILQSIFALYLHKPAKRKPVERVLRLAYFPEQERAWRISETKLIDAHA